MKSFDRKIEKIEKRLRTGGKKSHMRKTIKMCPSIHVVQDQVDTQKPQGTGLQQRVQLLHDTNLEPTYGTENVV